LHILKRKINLNKQIKEITEKLAFIFNIESKKKNKKKLEELKKEKRKKREEIKRIWKL
jgi:hypothetical protein